MTELDVRFAELKEFLDGTADEDLPAAVQSRTGGVDGVLDLVFDGIIGTFDAAKAGTEGGVFRFDVHASDGDHARFVTVVDGAAAVAREIEGAPTVVLGLELTDFLALATGRLTGSEAYLTGRLQTSGDLFFAMNWSEWFGTI